MISRLNQSTVLPGQLFFRTSAVSRCTGRFLNENRILPPLSYSACVSALESLRSSTSGLELHFADEEGDPYAVELAGRLGGYVIGNDSDFVIFNAEGYRGYIPLEELVWQTPIEEVVTPVNEENDGFQTVRKPKSKKSLPSLPEHAIGLLPPAGEDISLSFTSYSPEALAKHLNIPPSLLPLFGALVGNDFSKEFESNSRKIQALFFDRSLSLTQRIDKVASTIHTVVSPGPQQRKAKHQVGSVMDLIDRTVNSLLTRLSTTMGSGEIDAIIDKVVNATLQYALPKYGGDLVGKEGLWPTSVCALHEPESCSLLRIISQNVMRQADTPEQADPNLLEARGQYLDAYRGGVMSPKTMDFLNTSTSWPRLFLENPDLETVARSIGGPIREWVYSIVDDAVGLPMTEAEDEGTQNEGSVVAPESDEDELIDVVESDSEDENSRPDFLAPLKGELDRLHSEDEATEPPASIISHRQIPAGPSTIVEYLRRGSRIASDTITVKPISDLLSSIDLSDQTGTHSSTPIILRSLEDRFTIFLRILKSDLPAVRALPPDSITPVLALRWVIFSLHARWQETGSKEREKERWTKREARLLLSTFASSNDPSATNNPSDNLPPINDRNVQLMAQILTALETIEQLSQSLLLLQRVPSNAGQLSGRVFHGYLTGTMPVDDAIPNAVWVAAEENLSDAFQEERMKKSKKPKVEKSTNSSYVPKKSTTGGRGLFAMLGDIDG